MRIDQQGQGSQVYYLLSDHLGSTTLTVNASGVKVAEMRYDPWGSVRYEWGTQVTDYTYTGQRSEVGSFGLMFYNTRWYDPSLGRFAQADTDVPASQGVQAWDRFAYVNNNPLRYTDPTGHTACGDQYDPSCQDSGGSKEDSPQPKLPNSDVPPIPGQKVADALSIVVVVIDGVAFTLNLAEAVVVDVVGGVAIGAGVIVTTGGGPVGGVALGEAVKYTAMLDFAVTTTSWLGTTENILGVLSFGITAIADGFAGNTTMVINNGTWDGGVAVGKDTLVSARNMIAGVFPEANVDTLVGASQFWYDLQRITGRKDGGSVVFYGKPEGWKGCNELFRQIFINDWW